MKAVKAFMVWIFKTFGLGLYYLKDRKPSIDVEWTENFYRKKGFVFSSKRLAFYHELIGLLISRGIQPHNKSIIDIGCGDGRLLRILQDEYNPKDISGLDCSPEAVKLTKEMVPEADVSFDNLYLWNTNKKYDLVLCIEVMEHLGHPNLALDNLLQLTKADGYLLIVIPNGRTDNWEGHINFWSSESWTSFIQSKGVNNITGMMWGQRHIYAIFENGFALRSDLGIRHQYLQEILKRKEVN